MTIQCFYFPISSEFSLYRFIGFNLTDSFIAKAILVIIFLQKVDISFLFIFASHLISSFILSFPFSSITKNWNVALLSIKAIFSTSKIGFLALSKKKYK